MCSASKVCSPLILIPCYQILSQVWAFCDVTSYYCDLFQYASNLLPNISRRSCFVLIFLGVSRQSWLRNIAAVFFWFVLHWVPLSWAARTGSDCFFFLSLPLHFLEVEVWLAICYACWGRQYVSWKQTHISMRRIPFGPVQNLLYAVPKWGFSFSFQFPGFLELWKR